MQVVNHKVFCFRKTRSFVFLEKWVLANCIAELFCLGIIVFTSTAFSTNDNHFSQFILVLLGVFQGVILGTAQCLVLRGYIRNSGWWVLATTVGFSLGWLVVLFVCVIAFFIMGITQKAFSFLPTFLGITCLGAVMGMLLGLTQMTVLQFRLKVKFHKAIWWMNANALSWILHFFLVSIFIGIIPSRFFPSNGLAMFFISGLIGVIGSGITGIVLIHLLKLKQLQLYSP